MLYEMELRSAFPTMSSFAWSGKVHGKFSVSMELFGSASRETSRAS